MAIAHIVVLSAALLTLLCLPCVVAAAVCADDLPLRRRRARRADQRALRRLDRAFGAEDPLPALVDLDAPAIEQIARDLRRLDHQRRNCRITQQSEQWMAAVLYAYDQRLTLACRCLDLPEHLDKLDGLDRELERLRIESELQAAGLALRN